MSMRPSRSPHASLIWASLFAGLFAMTLSACQYSSSFEDLRCAQQSDCPSGSMCVDGYCMSGDAGFSDVPGQPLVATLQIDPASAEVLVGETVSLSANALDADGNVIEQVEVEWASTDDTIASVDDAGQVDGLAQGTAVITATAGAEVTTAKITVSTVPVASIEVGPDPLDLVAGETGSLSATLLDADGAELSGREVRWTSSNPTVAVVDDSGQVTAIGAGMTVITARSGDVEGSASVNVAPPEVASLTVSPTTASIVEGDTFALEATARDADGEIVEGVAIEWTSSDDTIATVGTDGIVSALAEGTATITATSGSVGATATITVVPVSVASVEVSPLAAQIEVGGTLDLSAATLAADDTELTWPTVNWTSSDDTIATVDANGTVTALATGTVSIVAEADGVTGSAAITVISPQPADLSVSPTSATLELGADVNLDATVLDQDSNPVPAPVVIWESSDSTVATVDASGQVFGLGIGTATITASTPNGLSATASIEVTEQAIDRVEVTPASATIEATDSVDLRATVRAADDTILEGRAVSWSSSDTGIATVDANGTVTGVAAGGPVTITATSGSKSASASITVAEQSVASVDVSPQLASVTAGATTQLSATPKAADGTALSGRTVNWTSDDTAIATVDGQGNVTGVAEGITLVRATADGKTGYASVRVEPMAVDTVTISPGDQTIATAETVQFSANVSAGSTPLSGRVVTWSSSDATVAVVDSDGTVTGIGGGQATISATSEGVTDTVTVTVDANAAPTADAQSLTTAEDTALSITLTGTDPEGGSLTFSIATLPKDGDLSGLDSATGAITYTPNTEFSGADSFDFTVTDPAGASATATISIEVTAANDAPVANDDAATTAEDTAVDVDVLANDTDAEGDALTATLDSTPSNGTATITAGIVTYEPAADFVGTDTLTYAIDDGSGGTDTATLTIEVAAVNDAPLAVSDSASIAEDAAATPIDVLANDSDPEGAALTLSSIDLAPAHGAAVISAGVIEYTPDANFAGTDLLIYTVADAGGATAQTWVEITVTPVNDAPVADAGADQTVNQNDIVQLDGSASFDVDGDALTYTWSFVSQPGGAPTTLSDTSVVSPTFEATKTGTYELQLEVSDGTTSATDTVIITSQ